MFFYKALLQTITFQFIFLPMNDTENTSKTPPQKPHGQRGKNKAKSDAAKERVAEALRANLRRRKVQSRDRDEQS